MDLLTKIKNNGGLKNWRDFMLSNLIKERIYIKEMLKQMKKGTMFSVVFLVIVLLFSGVMVLAADYPKAFRDVYFGDSKEVVRKNIENDRDGFHVDYFTWAKVGDKRFFFFEEYFEDKLYMVRFNSDAQRYFYNATVERDFLASMIQSKYGKATETANLDYYDLTGTGYDFSHFWSAKDTGEDKIIYIGYKKTEDGNVLANLTIICRSLLSEVAEAEEQKEKEQSSDF